MVYTPWMYSRLSQSPNLPYSKGVGSLVVFLPLWCYSKSEWSLPSEIAVHKGGSIIGAKPNLSSKAIELVCCGTPTGCVLVERKAQHRGKWEQQQQRTSLERDLVS